MQAVYSEASALVEDYQQALSVANVGGIRDLNAVFTQMGLRSSPQVRYSGNCLSNLLGPLLIPSKWLSHDVSEALFMTGRHKLKLKGMCHL